MDQAPVRKKPRKFHQEKRLPPPKKASAAAGADFSWRNVGIESKPSGEDPKI